MRSNSHAIDRMSKTTLVVLAAGMGSRYGGLKQIDPIGPNGEIILELSVYDAIQAGFDRVVFIIKKKLKLTSKKQSAISWQLMLKWNMYSRIFIIYQKIMRFLPAA